MKTKTENKAEKVGALVLKNAFLDFLYNLLNIPLHGREARARNRFLKLITPRINEINAERLEILKELSEKDEKGMPIMVKTLNKEGQNQDEFKLTPENLVRFRADYLSYLNEDLVLDILPSNKVDIGVIKLLLENTPKEFSLEDGQIYDALCESFEKALEGKNE